MDLGIPHLFAYDLETKDNRDRHHAIGPNPKGRLIVLPSSMIDGDHHAQRTLGAENQL
jgi:hypothetical protein